MYSVTKKIEGTITMEKNFNGKIGESDVIKIPVHDPRSTAPDTNSYISVILDFTISNPHTN